MLPGLPRRSGTILAAALLLTGTLSSCGFDLATNSVNTISTGINDRDGEVDVLGAVIISGAPDTGVFVATLANANPAVPISLTGLAGDVGPAEGLEAIALAPQSAVSLFDTGGVALTGPIGLGDFVEVELTFDSGQTTSINIPVVRPCFEYDPAKFPEMDLPGVSDAEGAESADAEEGAATQATDAYSCIPSEPIDLHGEGEAHAEGEE